MSKENLPIGIFDSGVGGLTVLKEVCRALPYEDIIYLGDSAHLPYGTKSKETIIKLSIANILFLLKKKVKIIIVACNSTSAVALPRIRKAFTVPIVGVVEAGVAATLQKAHKRVGIIGTPATINSLAYQKLLKKKSPSLRIIAKSCPLFVPLVEEGWTDSSVAEDVARVYLGSFRGKIDSLILACTHYPLLKRVIAKVLGKKVTLIDSAEEVAKKAAFVIKQNNLGRKRAKGKMSFFLSDNSPNFSSLVKRILKKEFQAKVVDHV